MPLDDNDLDRIGDKLTIAIQPLAGQITALHSMMDGQIEWRKEHKTTHKEQDARVEKIEKSSDKVKTEARTAAAIIGLAVTGWEFTKHIFGIK